MFKMKITENIPAIDNLKNVGIAASLKYLSNFFIIL